MSFFKKVSCTGATNKPDSIDPSIRPGKRFDTAFTIGIPDADARLIILKKLTKNIRLAPDFDMKRLAHHTRGYVEADLENLVTKGVENGRKRLWNCPPQEKLVQPSNDATDEPNMDTAMACFKSDSKMPDEDFENTYFELSDFEEALKDVIPCTKREEFEMLPDTTWEDVGALKKVKESLEQYIMWRLKYAEHLKKVLSPMSRLSTKGILLCGPPGTGKTLVAKAFANECNINFLSVSGRQILHMYVSKTENVIGHFFQKAKNSAPCVLFFDDMDCICRSRSIVNDHAARVITELMMEMDAIEESELVFVLGATNKLEIFDYDMFRPRRLGKLVFVDLPSDDERFDILKTLTKLSKDNIENKRIYSLVYLPDGLKSFSTIGVKLPRFTNKKNPKVADDVDLKEIASDVRCENFSGADLKCLVDAAGEEALSDYINSSKTGKVLPDLEIKKQHFHLALKGMRPSVSQEEREKCSATYLKILLLSAYPF